MKKWLGKKKKVSVDPGTLPSGGAPSSSRETAPVGFIDPDSSPSDPTPAPLRESAQAGSRGPPIEVLSAKPNYLDLESFTLPATALPMFSKTRDEEVELDRCRRCSDCFIHTFMDWTTKIIIGIPQIDDYKAISYIWGDCIQLPMRCSYCGHRFSIPMASTYRFRRLMMMTANSGDSVWLDALSIDQTSNEDKSKVIAVMGDIYSRAKTVAVLFPEADWEGFKLLYDLAQAATVINANKFEFSFKGQNGTPNPRLEELSQVCKQFYEMLSRFDQNLQNYKYWRRAWTFQEWTLARQISITWEGGMPLNMASVKTTILNAATLTSVYAFMNGAYATIKLGFPQASVPARFEMVRRLFPDEEAFDPPGMVGEMEAKLDLMLSSMSCGSALGLRAARGRDLSRLDNPEPIHELYTLRPIISESKDKQFRRRLCMAVSTFGISKREAGCEADLVNCWASMCNIKFPYDDHDSYATALQKVLHSLRTEHHVKVYNFLVSTIGASGEVDTNFERYACPHQQCNAGMVERKFYGIPIFTGRADTAIHLRLAIMRPITLPRLKGPGIELRKIKEASIWFVVPFRNHDGVLQCMKMAISGTVDQFVFKDVSDNVSDVLRSCPPAQLNRSSLAIVRIPLESPDANEISRVVGLVLWAIIPSDLDVSLCFIAREDLNGTLVLAAPSSTGIGLEVVAYLTLTDHQSGTLLINVDAHDMSCKCREDHDKGNIEIALKSPVTRGVINSSVVDDRMIRGTIRFETGSYTAY
jgi:hypothetical protein